MKEFLRGDTLYKMVIIHLIGYLLKKNHLIGYVYQIIML